MPNIQRSGLKLPGLAWHLALENVAQARELLLPSIKELCKRGTLRRLEMKFFERGP